MSTIESNGTRHLVFEIPDGLVGAQTVQVRTQYTVDGDLRIGELPDAVLPAES